MDHCSVSIELKFRDLAVAKSQFWKFWIISTSITQTVNVKPEMKVILIITFHPLMLYYEPIL